LFSGSTCRSKTGLRQRDGSTTPVNSFSADRIRRTAASCHRGTRPAGTQGGEQHIHYLAHHDALTSLPNRSHFNGGIDQEITTLAKGESLAVLCLDLDRSRKSTPVGHAAGDGDAPDCGVAGHCGAR